MFSAAASIRPLLFLKAGPCVGAVQHQEEPEAYTDDVRAIVAVPSADLPVEAPNQATPVEPQTDPEVENDPGAGNAQNSGMGPRKQLQAWVHSAKDDGVSQYEQARKQRMQDNFEKLRSLGLSGGITDVIGGVPTAVKKGVPKRPSKRKNGPEQAPVRRLTRSSAHCHLHIPLKRETPRAPHTSSSAHMTPGNEQS